MSYGNYVQGAVDTTNNGYNLLISGAPSGYTQSGLMIGGDTSTTYGVRVSKDATNNAYVDMRPMPWPCVTRITLLVRSRRCCP